MMGPACLLVFLLALPGQPPAQKGDPDSQQAARKKHEHLAEIYLNEAAGYSIYRDSSRQEKVELQRVPVYVWTNPVRDGGQDGAVFVWTCQGRPEVMGTFFSAPSIGPRKLYHEFHSLSLSVLAVARSGPHTRDWTPEAPGIELAPFTGAPSAASSPRQRLVQMRALSRDFTASTEDNNEKHWELRLLPQPLYRYESTDPLVLDGALFAFVTSAGTDPEALLVIEARKATAGGESAWYYAVGRFTDLNIVMRYKEKVILTAPFIPHDAIQQDPKHRYRVFHDRDIPAVEEPAKLNRSDLIRPIVGSQD
jgi:hypothetical protein